MLIDLNINEYTVLIFNKENEPIPFDDIISEFEIKILKITFD